MHMNRAAAERYNFQNQIRQAASDGRISIGYSLNFNVASFMQSRPHICVICYIKAKKMRLHNSYLHLFLLFRSL